MALKKCSEFIKLLKDFTGSEIIIDGDNNLSIAKIILEHRPDIDIKIIDPSQKIYYCKTKNGVDKINNFIRGVWEDLMMFNDNEEDIKERTELTESELTVELKETVDEQIEMYIPEVWQHETDKNHYLTKFYNSIVSNKQGFFKMPVKEKSTKNLIEINPNIRIQFLNSNSISSLNNSLIIICNGGSITTDKFKNVMNLLMVNNNNEKLVILEKNKTKIPFLEIMKWNGVYRKIDVLPDDKEYFILK